MWRRFGLRASGVSSTSDPQSSHSHIISGIEKELKVPPPPLNHIHPTRPLFEACNQLLETHARRLPLIDYDSASDMELIVSVLTQYRVLKFVANNVGCQMIVVSFN